MSFHFETDEKSFAGSSLIMQAIREMQSAFLREKKTTGLTQQALANRLGIKNRSTVNKWLLGRENISLRTIGEVAWALNRRAVITFEDDGMEGGNFYSDANTKQASQAENLVAKGVDSARLWKNATKTVKSSELVVDHAY
ncbi:helix-turn-helix transcriptional regulator [Methylobacterium bullatum]|uniref:helix-turn-helix transcriptional regulator n=1 Tax=Methylobacterium bullatum TaxID=570505 RepID=UPI00177D7613|nr:helix-turn-helix transcriptional regulator [Methylobacterium bullatum]